MSLFSKVGHISCVHTKKQRIIGWMFVYVSIIIAPLTGFTLSFRGSVIPSFCEHLVSTQYLENILTESDQILYTHQH